MNSCPILRLDVDDNGVEHISMVKSLSEADNHNKGLQTAFLLPKEPKTNNQQTNS